MTRPTPLAREQRHLRRSIRQVNRALKSGHLDLYSATTLITRLTNTLTRVQLADHHLTTNTLSHEHARFQAEIHRILTEIGLGPPEY